MTIMNSFIYDLFDRNAIETSKLVRYNKKHTLTAREIHSAVKLLILGELGRHAIIEGENQFLFFLVKANNFGNK